jgi:hypothetical protein
MAKAKKKAPKGPSEWELQQRKEKKREHLARAVGTLLLDRDVLWRFRRDDEIVHTLEELAEQLPTLRLLGVLEQLAAKEAEEHAAFEASFKKPRAKKATPAKKVTKPKATPAKAATPAAAKAAKKWQPTPRADLDNALPGYLEDEALTIANKSGAVTAGDLLKALPEATRGQATGALSRLVTRGRLALSGRGRGAKYTLANGAGKQVTLDEAAAPL